MSFEGTGKYFIMLFITYIIIVLVVKISLSTLFEKANIKGWKAFVPIYNKYLLIEKLDLNKKLFFMTLVPFVNLYYYNIIIERMLEAFEQNSKESILFLIVPLYKFPELALKNPIFKLHLYDNTEEFIHNEKSLFEQQKVEEINNVNMNGNIIINPNTYNQTGEKIENPYNDTVFSNKSLEPDERKETYIEAKQENQKQETNPITVNNLRPKVCPKCGTKLEPTAKTCFFCGTNV
jgi:ribosomal protein L40E